MKAICSWCGALMGDDGADDGHTTHGMCAGCLDEMTRKLDAEQEERKRSQRIRRHLAALQSLEVPV